MGSAPADRGDLHARIDELTRQVTAHGTDIDALGRRADKSDARADDIEARARVDRELIAELQSDGLLSREHAAQAEEALKSSRTIGEAIGLIMASRHVREDEAFMILKMASHNSDRRVRELAAELVTQANLLDPSE